MAFDDPADNIKCVTEHKDYSAFTNRMVLHQKGPLLKRKDGGYDQKKKHMPENDYVCYSVCCSMF